MKYLKCLLLIPFIFSCVTMMNAQTLNGLENPKERIMANKVRFQYVYFYKTPTDSNLTNIDLFDHSGNILSSRMISGDGSVARLDSFFYDKKRFLVKQICYHGNKIFYETTCVNDEKGRAISRTLLGDSIWYRSEISYADDGLHRMTLSFDKRDTIVNESFYNKKGQLLKIITRSKQDGTTIYKRKYSNAGNLVDVKRKEGNTETATQYKYDAAGNMLQSSTTTRDKNKTTRSGIAFSYYPNGLVFEKVVLFTNNYIQGIRAYYSYY